MSANIRLQLDDYLARSPHQRAPSAKMLSTPCCEARPSAANGRAIILDMTGRTVALVRFRRRSGGGERQLPLSARHTGPSGLSAGTAEFQFDHVTGEAALAPKRGPLAGWLMQPLAGEIRLPDDHLLVALPGGGRGVIGRRAGTILFRSLKAAGRNPVVALRSE